MTKTRSHFFSPFLAALAIALAAPLSGVFSRSSNADDLLVLQRAGGLYAADAGGASAAHRIGTVANPANSANPANPQDFQWAISPDGRRIATLTRRGVTTAGGGMRDRPAVVTVAEREGRHAKRLFSTETLHDRQGHGVTALGLGADAPTASFADWEPIGLSWSADSRTLYVACRAAIGGEAATFAVDGASGLALVDAQERWKSIASLVSIDAREGRLVGVRPQLIVPGAVLDQKTASPDQSTPMDGFARRGGAMEIIDLATATTTGLAPASGDLLAAGVPALDPALSPDQRRVAFATSGGLYLLDRKTQTALRLVAGSVARPRWTADGKSVYFLLVRPGSALAPVDTPAAPLPTYDLYAIDAPASLAATGSPAPLRLVLQGIDWFDLVPE